MINILDDNCKMIWRYRSPQCVFISNHGFMCCSVVIFGRKTVDLKPWSVSQLNIQSSAEFILIFPERWSETLCQHFLSGRVFASVCSKHCKHIVAGRKKARPRRVHRRRTRRTKEG